MSSEEVAAHFAGRTVEYVDSARHWAAKPFSMEFLASPYDNGSGWCDALWWLLEHHKTNTVIDFGCGAGRFVKFWKVAANALIYVGIEQVAKTCREAVNISPYEAHGVSFVNCDIRAAPKGINDVGFTHGVLMHVPPEDVEEVVAAIKARSRVQFIVELVRPRQEDLDAPHVFVHDYEALFGEPAYRAPINAHKDAMIFRGGS